MFDDVYLSEEYQPSSSTDDSDSAHELRTESKPKLASENTINVLTKSVEQAVPSNSIELENPILLMKLQNSSLHKITKTTKRKLYMKAHQNGQFI